MKCISLYLHLNRYMLVPETSTFKCLFQLDDYKSFSVKLVFHHFHTFVQGTRYIYGLGVGNISSNWMGLCFLSAKIFVGLGTHEGDQFHQEMVIQEVDVFVFLN